MLIGIILLSIVTIIFFIGKARGIADSFVNELTAVALLVITIVGSIVPPITVGNVQIYIGGSFLALMCILLIIFTIKRFEKMLSIISVIIGIVVTALIINGFFYKTSLNIYVNYSLSILCSAMISFIFSRNILTAFSSGYIGYSLGSIINEYMNYNSNTFIKIFGGDVFSMAIISGILAVLLYTIANNLNYTFKSSKRSFEGESSAEFDKTKYK